ncbi:urease accessory protein UreE [Deinococcus roseus]|uniref:Urease accessory protein UreE n=1 Tax=Deinococcus roseus TaxID=392414 RepID=A0ABQ2CYQ3_9DEIO|nr:urease accessory protein UreE [Deinococcus roseus]GGJ27482.1 urease accessory protein UreE [Deinococcus roseus]
MSTRLSGLKRSLLPQSAAEPVQTGPAAGLIRIDRLPEQTLQTLQTLQVVSLPMTCLDRHRVRRRLHTPDGLELGLALPTGTVLHPGMLLHLTPEKAYPIEAAPEEVLCIFPSSMEEALKVAHAIGNLHRDVQINGMQLCILHEPTMELALNRLGVHFERSTRAFLGKPAWEH